jgi:uncharacterized protein
MNAEVKFPATYPPLNGIVMDNLVAVPMRDGVKLYADVYRPTAPGKYPVIVSRTPYSTERAPNAYDAAVFFSQRGYVYVYQDVRGRHESEGKWEPFRDDIEDGYDTIEWAASQPWSNGKVGMQGGSYLGHVQWRAAMSKPPHLVAIFPSVAATSLYHDWITLNGGWRLSFNFGWGPVRQESRIMQNTGPHLINGLDGIHFDRLQRHLPLNAMQQLAGRNAQFYKDWIAHPDYDEYWKKLNAEEAMDRIAVPVHTFGGWFDIFSQGTLRGYGLISKKGATEAARKLSNMVIGPWGHGSSQKFGDLDFGAHAHVDTHALELRWFDFHLKGLANGLDKEPPVKIYVMGRNEWVGENEYPLARTQYKKMFLHPAGKLSWTEPADNNATPDQFRYDPDNPVPSLGGNNCCGTPTPAGPRDQRPLDARGDILRYTSDFLEQPLEVTGPVKLVLHAASDALDTDFIAKLIDVFPDGRALNMAEGIVRARYRDGAHGSVLLQPGKTYEFSVDMVGTSVQFQRGHRIRVDVTSSHFPQFDRNPNTGEPFGSSAKVKIALQTVHHSKTFPSHIVLPVIPVRP